MITNRLIVALVLNIPCLLLSIVLLFLRWWNWTFRSTPYFYSAQILNGLTQIASVCGAVYHFYYPSDYRLEPFSNYEKIYTTSNVLSNFSLCLIILQDVKILEIFSVLNSNITNVKIAILKWFTLLFFLVTHVLQYYDMILLIGNQPNVQMLSTVF
jgi:hypothetical protein